MPHKQAAHTAGCQRKDGPSMGSAPVKPQSHTVEPATKSPDVQALVARSQKLGKSPPAELESCERCSQAVSLSDPGEAVAAHRGKRFRKGERTADEFSWMWRRGDGERQRSMSRLLRWARHEKRVPQEMSLVDFFSQMDEEREWLMMSSSPRYVRRRGRR